MTGIGDLMWLVTGASLVGTVANIHWKRWCFAVWFVTNIIWTAYGWWSGAPAQAALGAAYVGLAVYGLYTWRAG